MTKRWLEDVGDFQGDGTLRDHLANEVAVTYRIIVTRERWETPTVGGVRRAGASSNFDATGVLTIARSAGFIDSGSHRLTLTLDDGRSMEIIPRVVRGPEDPIPFQVSKGGNVLLPDLRL